MIAAQCGAKHVYAIEANRNMAELATKLIGENGLSDRITVINKLSTQVEVGGDLPRRANVLVSEILGTLLLGESALAFVSDARDRLLEPGASRRGFGGTLSARLTAVSAPRPPPPVLLPASSASRCPARSQAPRSSRRAARSSFRWSSRPTSSRSRRCGPGRTSTSPGLTRCRTR